jgi:hypothetical protein
MSEAGDLPNGSAHNGDRRRELEQRASVVRSRLASRLDELEDRRERAQSVVRTLTTPPVSVVLLAAAGVALTTVVVVKRQRRRPRGFAWLADQLQPATPPQNGMIMGVVKRGVYSLLAFGVRHFAREGLARLEGAAARMAAEGGEGAARIPPVYTPPRP